MRLNETELNEVLVQAMLDPKMAAKMVHKATPEKLTEFDGALRVFYKAFRQGSTQKAQQESRDG